MIQILKKRSKLDSIEAYAACICTEAFCSCICTCACACTIYQPSVDDYNAAINTAHNTISTREFQNDSKAITQY